MTDVVECSEVLVPGPAEALGGLLGVRVPDVAAGLPLLWHWVYLLDRAAQDTLGPDGHPATGGIPVPPGPGRRRMFAGGRVRTSGALRCGELATRGTRVLTSVQKQGRSGRLSFVTVGHEIGQRGRVVVSEEQDIVYRDADAGPPKAACAEDVSPGIAAAGEHPHPSTEWVVEPNPVLLFRFSALTYNAHRIHYDRDYARDVEGYPGLVVHGPLQAMLMAEAVRRVQPDVEDCAFAYRLLSPLFDKHPFTVSAARDGDGYATRVAARAGGQTASGRLTFPG